MDNEQISNILLKNNVTRKYYRGCFPCNLLPNPTTLKYPCALIVNMEPFGFDGSHWIALFASGIGRELIYFDSLLLPVNIIINNDFLIHFPKVVKNKKTFQSFTANTCAYYCILFIYFLSIGYPFSYFLQILDNSVYSDLFVRELLNDFINV